MKKRIDGHVLDTRKARLLGTLAGESISTALFRSKSGVFFVLKYAGGDPANPELGAIEAVDAAEAQALYRDDRFAVMLDGAFDERDAVRTSIELDPAVRDRLQYLCRYTQAGERRPARLSMGDVVAELLGMR